MKPEKLLFVIPQIWLNFKKHLLKFRNNKQRRLPNKYVNQKMRNRKRKKKKKGNQTHS